MAISDQMFVHNNSKHGRRAKRLDASDGTSPLSISHPLAPDSTYDGLCFFFTHLFFPVQSKKVVLPRRRQHIYTQWTRFWFDSFDFHLNFLSLLLFSMHSKLQTFFFVSNLFVYYLVHIHRERLSRISSSSNAQPTHFQRALLLNTLISIVPHYPSTWRILTWPFHQMQLSGHLYSVSLT